jgi:hypothetical protein
MSGIITPMVLLVRLRRLWAKASGRYLSSAIALWTSSRFAIVTEGWPLTTRDTVPTETPAFLAVNGSLHGKPQGA